MVCYFVLPTEAMLYVPSALTELFFTSIFVLCHYSSALFNDIHSFYVYFVTIGFHAIYLDTIRSTHPMRTYASGLAHALFGSGTERIKSSCHVLEEYWVSVYSVLLHDQAIFANTFISPA
jgi:hypothetical protein